MHPASLRAHACFWAAVLCLVLYLAVNLVLLGVRIARGIRFASESAPFEMKNVQAGKRVLVVGDSTGVGTGAGDPSQSIAGRIAKDYTCVEIVNIADDGVRIRDAIIRLDAVRRNDFDLILVQAGGNDILRFTELHGLRLTVGRMLEKALSKGRHVIFLSSGNVGNAPAFFPPLSWLYTHRTRLARDIFREVSGKLGVEYVDLFSPRREDPFLKDPSRYFARDYLHPSGQGYDLWYGEVRRQSSLDSVLRCLDSPDTRGKGARKE